MLPYTKYYLVRANTLIDIDRLLPTRDASVAADELQSLTANAPGDELGASVFVKRLTEKTPGPLGAETVRKLADKESGMDLMEYTDSNTGEISYLIPQKGELRDLGDMIEPMDIRAAAAFYEELDILFNHARMAGSPAGVRHITIGQKLLADEPELYPALVHLASAHTESERTDSLTVLEWTE